MSVLVSLVAFLIERYLGYPQRLVEKIGHPVIWQGAIISTLEDHWGGQDLSPRVQKIAGIAMLVTLIALTLLVTLVLHLLLRAVPLGWVIEALLASSFLASKSLGASVHAVDEALGENLGAGRVAVGHIVGRETDELTESGVVKGAIESLAENCSDGVIAPLFWMVIFGLPGIAVYKAINTADSMVGHKNTRYLHFGWAAAKLDDLVNWLPARGTLWLVIVAAIFVKGARPMGAARSGYNDARKHVSPNAGWPEAGFGGALGVVLGGARAYDGVQIQLAEMGAGQRILVRDDIARALALYEGVLDVVVIALIVIALLAGALFFVF